MQFLPNADPQSKDEFVASEVERALRYQKRAHSRRNSEIGTGPTLVPPMRDATPNNGVSQAGSSSSTPTIPNPRSPTHSHVFEHKARAPSSPIELHYIQLPKGSVLSSSFRDPSPDDIASSKEPRIQYPVPPTQWDKEDEEDKARPSRFSSPKVWLDLVETFKRDHLSTPVKAKPKASPSPTKRRFLIPHLSSSSSPDTEPIHGEDNAASRAVTLPSLIQLRSE